MRRSSLLLLLLVLCWSLPVSAEDAVRVWNQDCDGYALILAENLSSAPVTIALELELTTATCAKGPQSTAVLEPGASATIATIRPETAGGPFWYKYQWSWQPAAAAASDVSGSAAAAEQAAAQASAAAAETSAPVRIWSRDFSGYSSIFTENNLCAPVTVTLEPELTAAACDEGDRPTAVVPPGATATLATIRPDQPGGAYHYNFNYWYQLGDASAVNYTHIAYRLPYAPDSAFTVIQGNNGTLSHFGDQQYAIDWDMPEGTPVHAAREGRVVTTESSFSEGGFDPSYADKANYIHIAHDDGTIAQYLHLRSGGVAVSAGQRVAAGELIGWSGNTGNSTCPHLHFRVMRPRDGRVIESLPVRFLTTAGVVTVEEGMTYTSPATIIGDSLNYPKL